METVQQIITTTREGYITKDEVARRMKKTTRTVEKWQKRGIIPFVKCGHAVLFDWADVQRHLEANYRVCAKAELPASAVAHLFTSKN